MCQYLGNSNYKWDENVLEVITTYIFPADEETYVYRQGHTGHLLKTLILTRCVCTCVFTTCTREYISSMPVHIICTEGDLALTSVDRPNSCIEFGR